MLSRSRTSPGDLRTGWGSKLSAHGDPAPRQPLASQWWRRWP